MVHAVRRTENEFVGAPTGSSTRLRACLAGRGVRFCSTASTRRSRTLDLWPADSGLALVVIDTRTSHDHADGEYANRRHSCERAADMLGVRMLRELTVADLATARSRLDAETFRRARHIVTENERVREAAALLEAGAPREIGPILLASHSSMRDDFEISTPVLDLAVDAADTGRCASVHG